MDTDVPDMTVFAFTTPLADESTIFQKKTIRHWGKR